MNADEFELLIKVIVGVGTVAAFFALKYAGTRLLAWWRSTRQPTVQNQLEGEPTPEKPSEVGEIVLRALARDLSEWHLAGSNSIEWQGILRIGLPYMCLPHMVPNLDVWWGTSSLLLVLNQYDRKAILQDAREILECKLLDAVKTGVDEIVRVESARAVEATKEELDKLEERCLEALKVKDGKSPIVFYPVSSGTTYTIGSDPGNWYIAQPAGLVDYPIIIEEARNTLKNDIASGTMTIEEVRNVRKNEGESNQS